MPPRSSHRFCVAPMMDWTDRHCRVLLRLISRRARLYTEMVTSAAVRFGDRARLLGFSPEERPLALQLGGSDPAEMALAAGLAEAWGYDEVNINVGCPSNRVQAGRFGACLMKEPATVAACIAAMRKATRLPVTVKSRIGVDDRDSYADLRGFVETVAAAGCDTVIVHARKAWLSGLSPKQNREVPPLHHDLVYRLKQELPGLAVVLNGGLRTLDAAAAALAHVDGVMIGREAYQNPFMLAEADRRLLGDERPAPDRFSVVEAYLPYIERQLAAGTHLAAMTRHMLGLFQGQPGARAWRRALTEQAPRPGAGPETVRRALDEARAAADHHARRQAARAAA